MSEQVQLRTAYIFITPPNACVEELANQLRIKEKNNIFLNYVNMENTLENQQKYFESLERLLNKNPNTVILLNTHHVASIRRRVVSILIEKIKDIDIKFISFFHPDGIEAFFDLSCIGASKRTIKNIRYVQQTFEYTNTGLNILDSIEHNIELIYGKGIENVSDPLSYPRQATDQIAKLSITSEPRLNSPGPFNATWRQEQQLDDKLTVESFQNDFIQNKMEDEIKILDDSAKPSGLESDSNIKPNNQSLSNSKKSAKQPKKQKKPKVKSLMYIGLKLTKETKEDIIKRLLDLGLDIKTYKKQYLSHATLLFVNDATRNDVPLFDGLDGKQYDVEIIGYCKDECGMALAVKLPEGTYCCNTQPHITCAMTNTEPVYSNELFTKYEIIAIEPFIIPTILTFNYVFVDSASPNPADEKAN
jgi:hypothetical protein